MKKNILAITTILIFSALNFQTIAQVKTDSASIRVRVNKMIAKLNTNVQLTTEQTIQLKELYIKRETIKAKMMAAIPQSVEYSQLQSEYQNMNQQLKGLLTDEQRTKLEEKRKASNNSVNNNRK